MNPAPMSAKKRRARQVRLDSERVRGSGCAFYRPAEYWGSICDNCGDCPGYPGNHRRLPVEQDRGYTIGGEDDPYGY
jgi:hypothetical protein